jgi:phage tail-like protein
MLAEFDPIATYAYHVEIDSITVAQFKQVSGLSISVGVIEHRSNKLMGQPVLKKLPGAVRFDDIVLSRGKVADQAFWSWIKLVQDGKIAEARKSGSIVLFDYSHGEVNRFNFEQAWPSKIEVGKLEAGSDSVLLETVTITHESLKVA